MHRPGDRGGHLGSDFIPRECDRAEQCPPPGHDRRCSHTDDGTTPGSDAGSSKPECQPRIADPATTLMLEQRISEFNQFAMDYLDDNMDDESFTPSENNQVLQEMLVYGRNHGFLDKNNKLLMSSKPLIDCLEIYCAEDSQLTRQCRNQNIRALRFGLKEGDLGTIEGTEKKYSTSCTDTDRVMFGCHLDAKPGVKWKPVSMLPDLCRVLREL